MFKNRTFLSAFIIVSTLSININASSHPVKVTKANFKTEILKSNLPVILAYFSLQNDWDSNLPIYKNLAQERSLEQQKKACKIMLAIFLELARDRGLIQKYKFAILDVDSQADLALNQCNVNIIPSFELYQNGISMGGFDSLELQTADKEKIKILFKKYLAQLKQ